MSFKAVMVKFIDGGLWTRDEWSEIFNVPREEVDQWVKGTALPSAPVLRALYHIVQEDRRYPMAEFLAAFNAPMKESLADGTWRAPRLWGSTLLNLSMDPMREGFLRVLETLEPADQEKVMAEASEHMRRIRRERRS